MSELATYDVMSKIAIIALKRDPFGSLQPFPCAAVSKRRFVLQYKRDSPASADLSATECTKPIDSVHIVTMRFSAKLRNSVFVELVVGKIAIMPVNTAGTASKGALRQAGDRTTSLIVCL